MGFVYTDIGIIPVVILDSFLVLLLCSCLDVGYVVDVAWAVAILSFQCTACSSA